MESDSEPDADPMPELVSTSDEDSDDEPYAGSGNLPSDHLGHYPPRHHRSIPDARCPEDDTNPFYRSSWHRRCDTGFTMLNPAYQNPDRRGRAGVAHGDKTIEDEKACRFYSEVPFLEESLGHPLGGDRSCECSRQNN